MISALKALLAYDLSALRKYAHDDSAASWSAVRKYETAFQKNTARGRSQSERAKAALTLVSDDGDDPAA